MKKQESKSHITPRRVVEQDPGADQKNKKFKNRLLTLLYVV